MRHNKSGRKLNRNPAHRKALFRNMSRALLEYGRIRTTEAKAMELRGVIEPLITMAKKNDLHARREAYKFLNNHQLVKKLFDVIAPLFAGVPGGYTRVIKLGMPRKGDAAPLAVIEFIKDISGNEEAAAETRAAKAKGAVKEKAAVKNADTGDKAAPENAGAEPSAADKEKPKRAAGKSKTAEENSENKE